MNSAPRSDIKLEKNTDLTSVNWHFIVVCRYLNIQVRNGSHQVIQLFSSRHSCGSNKYKLTSVLSKYVNLLMLTCI